MSHLFDDQPCMDPDYRAAVEFCRDIFPDAPTELLPGASMSTSFCPIARTLDRGSVCEIPEDLTADWIEGNGGGSRLFAVGTVTVEFPAIDDWVVDLIGDRPTDEEIERYLASGFDYDEGGGEMLRHVVAMPPAVQRFITRFDAGEFPGLRLDLEESTR